jgi:hypothetical protein
MCSVLKKIMKLQKAKPKWNVDILFAAQQKAKHFVEYNLFESGMKLGM